MSEITIIKGEEFKIAVKKEIKQDDIFISEYKRAAGMLDEIAGALKEAEKEEAVCSWKESDFENNIIAFCGERGEGKSSVMMSFANAVYEDKNKKNIIFEECKNLKNLKFAEPIMMYIMCWILYWQSFLGAFVHIMKMTIRAWVNRQGSGCSIGFRRFTVMFR